MSKEGSRRSPGRSVATAVRPLGTQLRAQRDQLGQIGDGVDLVERRDPNESVGVQVVAEQQCIVRVRRREQSRPAEMQQVPLVDRLQAEREPLLGEREKIRSGSHSDSGSQCRPPERALLDRLVREPCQTSAEEERPAASIVMSISASPWASETNIASNCDGAT